ncbi:Winged helix-turn-helix DNA-binding [Dehalogenimonas alkenigignens]|uniref:Winged helix-turn-helix DNA-binding n=1 Tax=Dehalogenimonas alkenigignens TaxID=1217799 RepID=A0A0W0GGY0_9CHLR|nr:helix-turn-helix domain-containing protein [Dehalogenimonas alkenigignens]KTB47803.1 Winged helix-turn-helix DNA-binding [Dehalogenimonas alkenigignens]
MITNGNDKTDFTPKLKEILSKEPGLSVKEIAEKLGTNRQFMAGVLKVLEERGEVTYRQVGPARIYYAASFTKGKNHW